MTDHRADAERLLPESRSEEAAQTHALLAIHDTLAEIRDRLPETLTVKASPHCEEKP